MTPARMLAVLSTAALTLGGAAAYAGTAQAARSAAPGAASADVLVVATNGNNSNAGTVAAPLRSIKVALSKLPHGGTIELRAGHYAQRIRLAGVHDITIRPYGHEAAVLDGTSLTPPKGTSAMVNISGSTDVTISGLGVTGYHTYTKGIVPIGIYLHGHDNDIHIVGNHVHTLGNYNKTLGSFNINAHGIAAYGDNPHAAIRNLVISGNERRPPPHRRE